MDTIFNKNVVLLELHIMRLISVDYSYMKILIYTNLVCKIIYNIVYGCNIYG